MKKRIYIFIFFFLIFSYGLYLAQVNLTIFPEGLSFESTGLFYDYAGVINVQSSLSAGSGTIPEIIASAQEADLDFIYFTDFHIFNKPKEFEGYHDKTLVFIDGEYSYLDSRLLVLDAVSDDALEGPGQSQVMLGDLISQPEKDKKDGVFILSHPYKPGYEWSGPYPPGLDGIEVVNLKSIWQNAWINKRASFLWTLFVYPFNPKLSFIRLFDDPEKEFMLLDKLQQHRKTLAVAGADAESKIKIGQTGILKAPSYTILFSLVKNHILLESELTGDSAKDTVKINQAFRDGQFYFSLDLLGDPKGFYALVRDKKQKNYLLGSAIKWQDGLKLHVHLPNKPVYPVETVIYRNGEKVDSSSDVDTAFTISHPGVYRVAVKVQPTFPLPDGKMWKPWIYTNSFYIR